MSTKRFSISMLFVAVALVGAPSPAGSAEGGAKSRLDARVFFFGHSLVSHPEPNSQVGSAMCHVASSAGDFCCANGVFSNGFEPTTFAAFPYPPEPSHGHFPSCWAGTFTNSRYDVVVMTESNFAYRERKAKDGFPEDAIALANKVRADYPKADLYLYEHWPEFDGLDLQSWKTNHWRRFHGWFAAMQDAINAKAPKLDVKLIPVGYVFARLVRDGPLQSLKSKDLFLDTAPHGTPTAYFIAGLVHYMAIYGKRPPLEATVPEGVHPAVQEDYAAVVETAWNTLRAVKDGKGRSRVFRSRR